MSWLLLVELHKMVELLCQPASAERDLCLHSCTALPSLCAAAGLTFPGAEFPTWQTPLLGREVFLPSEWIKSGCQSQELTEVMQGQWQEYFWRKMVLEMGILQVGGSGWLSCAWLCSGCGCSAGSQPMALCEVGVLWVTLSFTECPLPALLSAACVCSSLLWGWSCLTRVAWCHQHSVGILLL